MLNLRDTKKNIGEKSIEWAIYANKDFNVHVRKFGFQNTRVWFLEAIQAWSDEFEDQFSDAYELQIEDWRATSNGDDLDRLADNIKEHLEKNKFKTKYVNKFNFISLLMIIGGVLSGIFLGPNIDFEYFKLISYGLSLVFLVVLIVRIATAGSRFRKKVNMTMSVFNGLAQEITLYRETYFKNRDKKMTLLSLIEHLQEEIDMNEKVVNKTVEKEANDLNDILEGFSNNDTNNLTAEKLKEINKKLPTWSIEPPKSLIKRK